MGLYERILEEASSEERPRGDSEAAHSYGRVWSLPVPGAGGYVTVEDLEWEHKRHERERIEALRGERRKASELRVLRGFARRGGYSWVEEIAFRSLQRKYPGEWDRIRWE